jgi:hypothetical protein
MLCLQYLLYVVVKVSQERINTPEDVRLFMVATMPVVALASLVVITDKTSAVWLPK